MMTFEKHDIWLRVLWLEAVALPAAASRLHDADRRDRRGDHHDPAGTRWKAGSNCSYACMRSGPPAGDAAFISTGDCIAVVIRDPDGVTWLTQGEIARVLGTTPDNVRYHIKAIYDDGVLDCVTTRQWHYLLVTQSSGSEARRGVYLYSIDRAPRCGRGPAAL